MLCCRVCSLQPCGHLLGKGWPLGCRVCCVFLCFVTFPNVSWFASELSARLAPWNWFKPSCKILLLTVPRRYFFCGSLVFFCVLWLSCFRSSLPCGYLLRRGWLLGSCWWWLLYFCYFPMWYPGSGVVLDCIVSWSLSPSYFINVNKLHIMYIH